jgi:cyclohexanone monooxygenase
MSLDFGANIPGKPLVFMPYIGGFPAYVERCHPERSEGSHRRWPRA